MPKDKERKQINVMVDPELYEEYKTCVDAAGRKLVDFNYLIFSEGMKTQIAAFKSLKSKTSVKLFSQQKASK